MSIATATLENWSVHRSFAMKQEKQVLLRIASGDQSAVEDCLDQYGGLVWSLCRRWNSDDADDAAQEIFVQIWQQAKRYDPNVASEATFISMIARRRLIDRSRRRNAISSAVLSMDSFDELESQSEALDSVDTADEVGKAKRCLQRLTEVQQKVLELSIFHGVSHSGISDQLSLPIGSVKSFARRGLIQVRDCMQSKDDVLRTALTGEGTHE